MYDFVLWVASGTGAGVIFSYFAEQWTWYQEQENPKFKRILAILITSILALGAYAAAIYVPSSFWVAVTPYWQIVVGVAVANGFVQLFHRLDKTLL